jgi:hydrogenase nickel incorporation protein HypB
MDYDIERVKQDCRAHNPKVKIFETSAKTGQGLDAFFQYLKEQKKYL